jgi:hypothetical protein
MRNALICCRSEIHIYINDVRINQLLNLYVYDDDDDDVYLEYYSGKGFHMKYSSLYVLRKTHKLVQICLNYMYIFVHIYNYI